MVLSLPSFTSVLHFCPSIPSLHSPRSINSFLLFFCPSFLPSVLPSFPSPVLPSFLPKLLPSFLPFFLHLLPSLPSSFLFTSFTSFTSFLFFRPSLPTFASFHHFLPSLPSLLLVLVGHRLYTIDAAHMNANFSGFCSNLFLLTRLDGGGKVLVLGYMLTTRHESGATWEHFLQLSIEAGAQIDHRHAAVLSDRDKGIAVACRCLHIMFISTRIYLQHAFISFVCLCLEFCIP